MYSNLDVRQFRAETTKDPDIALQATKSTL